MTAGRSAASTGLGKCRVKPGARSRRTTLEPSGASSTTSSRALRLETAAVQLDQVADKRQAEARPRGAGTLALPERLEDVRERLARAGGSGCFSREITGLRFDIQPPAPYTLAALRQGGSR